MNPNTSDVSLQRTKHWPPRCSRISGPGTHQSISQVVTRFCLGYILCFAVLLLPHRLAGVPTNNEIALATAAVEAAVPRSQADPARPIFHVTAPAQWINDPNGPIYHNGSYHLFYQLHPFSDGSGPKYWGHVRSSDLVKWEHLPIALAPSGELGEEGVWSGCCVTNVHGQPMIVYTSVAHGRHALDHAEQWVATSDEGLIHWEKSSKNPVLSEALHGDLKIYDWRDPFIFREDGKTFMVLGGSLNHSEGGQAVVNIYEAEDGDLMNWQYRGVLYRHPDAEVRTAECPNFFRLGDEWVLFVSPYGRVQYFIGAFDTKTCRFRPRIRGVLDYGSSYYAPNTMLVPDGRRLVWGWVKDFPGGHGWNGCLSLPRLLSFSPEGQLLQNPAPQLAGLRGPEMTWEDISIRGKPTALVLPEGNTLEVDMNIDLQSATRVWIEIYGTSEESHLALSYDGLQLQVLNQIAPLYLPKGNRKLSLRVYVDRSVLEVFANESVCLTAIITPLGKRTSLEIHTEGGDSIATRIQAWPIKTIW